MQNWQEFLAAEQQKPYFINLMEKVATARAEAHVYPPEEEVYSSLWLCPYENVKVVILGQDPYHRQGQAHGLSFSVKPGVKVPPSLKNIYKELNTDLNIPIANHGYLASWAEQGVLMMNTTWTVTEGKAGSHKNFGWKEFTNHILEELNQYKQPIVFLLWGNHAIEVAKCINNPKHLKLVAAHPSPLARGAFFGSKPFSQANTFLEKNNRGIINWQLPEINDEDQK